MKSITYCMLALILSLATGRGEPVQLTRTIPIPWNKEILKDTETASSQLKSLLEEGRLEEFYVLAKKKLHDSRQELKETNRYSEKGYLDRLWMLYYITAVPLLTVDYSPDVPHPRFNKDDYVLKRAALMQIAFELISDEDYLMYERQHHKELVHLFSSYSAGLLKRVRESYDPDLGEKLKKMKFQPRKDDPAEISKRNYLFFINKQILRDNRNSTIPSYINMMEELLMGRLWSYFHGQPREVEKYIKLAGYQSEEEIDELIFRTLARTPKTEFLYQGARGKRYERKIRSGKESSVNDRYLHSIDRALKAQKAKAGQ